MSRAIAPRIRFSAREDPLIMRGEYTPLASLAIMRKNIPPDTASVSPFDVSPKNVSRREINLTVPSCVECPLL